MLSGWQEWASGLGGQAGCVLVVWLGVLAGWLAVAGWLARPRPPCVVTASHTEPNSGARKVLLVEVAVRSTQENCFQH